MKTYLKERDVHKIIKAAGNARDRLMMLLLWVTGVRVSELINIKPKDLDTQSKVLIVRRLKAQGERYRQIPVRPDVCQELDRYIQALKLGPDTRVFGIQRWQINRIIRGAAQLAGFAGKVMRHPESNRDHYISPHTFRSALAVLWMQRNPDLISQKALQSMYGHQSFNTTARYVKLGLEDVAGVYKDLWKPGENGR